METQTETQTNVAETQVNKEEKVNDAETRVNTEEKQADTVTENGAAQKDDEMNKKIMQQIEYYFGDYNLPRDKFLREEIKKDDGWVSLDTMLKFARLAKITKDAAIIASAIKTNEKTFMEVDSKEQNIRRSKDAPLPDLDEDVEEAAKKRTVYCKGFPKEGTDLDHLLAFFKQFGEYDAVRMRHFTDKEKKSSGFKGSVFVIFKTQELAETFVNGPPTMHKKTYLIKKWFNDYIKGKKDEYEERQAKKAAAKEDKSEKEGKAITKIEKGSYLKATGFAEDTSREDIQKAMQDLTGDCQHVGFKKGDQEALLRVSSGKNAEILAVVKDNLKVKDADISVSLVEGEEEEEAIKKATEAMMNAKSNHGQKRKGRFGGRGGAAKRGRR